MTFLFHNCIVKSKSKWKNSFLTNNCTFFIKSKWPRFLTLNEFLNQLLCIWGVPDCIHKTFKNHFCFGFWEFYQCRHKPQMQGNWFKNSLGLRKREKKVIFWCKMSFLTFFHLDFDFTIQLWNKKVTFFSSFFVVFYVLNALEFLHTWRFLIKYMKHLLKTIRRTWTDYPLLN